MVMSLDPTEEQYQTLQIILHQELFSMIHAKKANKKHQIHSSFHSKDFSESQQLHIWPTIGLLLMICVRQMMQESQSRGPYAIISTY